MKRHTEIPEAVYTNVVNEEVKETSPDDSFDKLDSPDPQQEQVPLAPDCPTGNYGPVQAAQSQDYIKQGHGGIRSGGDTPTVTGESDLQNKNASVGAGGGDGSTTNGNGGDFDLDLRSCEPSMDAANSGRPEQRLPGQDEPAVTKSEDSSQAAMPSLQESNDGREDAAVEDDEQSGGNIATLRDPSDDQSESERKDEEQERSEESGQPDKQQRQDDNGSAMATASTLNTLETGVYVLTSVDIEQITKGKSKLISNEGAFGPVYEGEFIYEGPLKGSRVAVKILDTSGTHGEREYKREKSVAGIKHPNILPVFGVCEDEGHPMCIVYPYMENRDLAYQISQKNPALTWQRRIVIAIGLCRAVLYLHWPTGDRKIKVYHRDIKSANVLLSGSWWPYLGDTGLTREIAMEKTHLSQTGSQLCVSGTRGYQDPVLIMKPANYYDDFCDIYSLGKVLLELLTNVLAQETDDENTDYVHSQWLEDEILEDPDALSAIAVKSSVGWPQLEENEVAKEFAKVVISCLRTARRRRAKLQDTCQKLQALAAANNIPLCVDTETKMCAICLRNHTASIPLSCGCKIACDECLKSYRTNAIKCPCHGATEPQSIHKESTGTQSTIEEMDEP
ncbi:uncharacterized protein [Ptychodera flava]|uniref:uncharacterized protein isoform X2 n=1 Tax=Ptychodera flava TaxID=63121 RepID=UPI00396A4BA6